MVLIAEDKKKDLEIVFLKEGELVEAELLSKTPKAAYFSLGKFGTGVVYGSELSNAKEIVKNINLGEKIGAKVVLLENDEGFAELSLAGAHKQKEWQAIREMMESGEILRVKIAGANRGGLIAKINNIKAFLPLPQLSGEHYPRVENGEKSAILEELKKLVGAELAVKIIDANPRADRLIISEKAAIEEDVKKLLQNYKVGDVVGGVVSGITNFGVFMKFKDEPLIEGLIHISELSHRMIESPKEIASVSDEIKAKIVEIKDGQVFLSLKALASDPWHSAEEKFKEKQIIDGVVYKFNPLGALINLEHDLQGLIHVSEFGSVEEMKKQLEIGKSRRFVVESVKPQEKRIILKLADKGK